VSLSYRTSTNGSMAFCFALGGRPRKDSNLRTRFRKPMLYPLSYGGSDWLSIAQYLRHRATGGYPQVSAPMMEGDGSNRIRVVPEL
jgi:hypothetical protein